jgi:hypothetical protein
MNRAELYRAIATSASKSTAVVFPDHFTFYRSMADWDRGRNRGFAPAPPSEPDGRFSRIRLSG